MFPQDTLLALYNYFYQQKNSDLVLNGLMWSNKVAMGWIRLCGGGKQRTAGWDADNQNSSTSSTNVFQRHPQMGVFAKSSHPDYLQRRIPWLGWRNLTEVGQNLTQKVRNTTNIQYIPKKNHTTNITQRPLCDPFITISFAHKAKKSGKNWQNDHLLKKSVLSFMEVSSREVCYGYIRNLCFVGCKQCSCLWIRGLKRQERKWSGAACGNAFIRARACSNMLVLVLRMYFHQGTTLWQWCSTCTICNMLVAMSFIRARACVSVLVLVIVICDVLVARRFHQGTGWPRERWLWNFAQTDDYSLQTDVHYTYWFIVNFISRRDLPLARKCLLTCTIEALVWWGD